jgi:4-amino-4-deoxy-L-arabinose transferase-like glycosyltransferase
MLFDPVPAGIRTIGTRYRLMHLRAVLGKDSTAVLSLTAIWLLVELLVHPAGEFPLIDDWSYTRSLQQWYETHHYTLIGWTSMPLVAQLAWGMLFCKVFGFSFTVLRYSTLVLGWIGGIGAYFLSREFSDNKGACFFTALLLLLNPIYLSLSNTFMTDVPFTSCLILSLLFFVRGLRQDRLAYIIQGICFITIATLIRQLGLLAAGAFAIAMVAKEGFSPFKGWRLRTLLIAALSVGVPLGAYLLYNHWLGTQHIYPVKYDEGVHRIRNNLFGTDHSTAKFLLRQALNIFVYAGFFVFPFVFRTDWASIWKRRRSPGFLICIALMAGMGIYCLIHHNRIPLMGNVMNPYGLGPVDVRDITILRLDHIGLLPAIFWQLLCLVGITGGGFLLLSMIRGIRSAQKEDKPALLFLLCFAAFYCLIMLVGGTYDRYLIPLIPVLSVMLLTGLPVRESAVATRTVQAGRFAALVFLLAGAWFSIAGTANFLALNRARWDALHYLTYEAGIPPSSIDGGFEFNGYYNYNDGDISYLKEKADPTLKSWWWVKDDAYLVAFGPVEGYSILKTFSSRHTVPPFTSPTVFVLKRN